MKVFKMHIGPGHDTDNILFLHFKEMINVGLFLQMRCLVGGEDLLCPSYKDVLSPDVIGLAMIFQKQKS